MLHPDYSHVALESCRCDEYKEAVDKFHFFLPGTQHHLIPRLEAPEGYCFRWVKNKTSYDNPQFLVPKLVRWIVCEETTAEGNRQDNEQKCRDCHKSRRREDAAEKCIPPKLRVIDGVIQKDRPVEEEAVKGIIKMQEQITSKWIPVLPGLISQRLVNENKEIHTILL